MKLVKDANTYAYEDPSGHVVSKLNYYRYDDIPNFDWILVANLDTDPRYRKQGLATNLLNTLFNDIPKDKGLYMLVKIDNHPAIHLYKSLGFQIVKRYTMKDGPYVVMAKGSADIGQLKRQSFGN